MSFWKAEVKLCLLQCWQSILGISFFIKKKKKNLFPHNTLPKIFLFMQVIFFFFSKWYKCDNICFTYIVPCVNITTFSTDCYHTGNTPPKRVWKRVTTKHSVSCWRFVENISTWQSDREFQLYQKNTTRTVWSLGKSYERTVAHCCTLPLGFGRKPHLSDNVVCHVFSWYSHPMLLNDNSSVVTKSNVKSVRPHTLHALILDEGKHDIKNTDVYIT